MPRMWTACDYVHLNPIRAKLLEASDRLLAYPWSSFPLYLAAPKYRPAWLRVDRLLGEHGIQQDTPLSRQEFERHMERRRLEEMDPEALQDFAQRLVRRQWAFRNECLEKMEDKLSDNHPGRARLETAAARAGRLIAQELVRLNWASGELTSRAKSDPQKLALAARLRRETTLSIKRIAERLNLGKPKGAKSNLHKWMNGKPDDNSQPKLDI